MGCGPSVLDIGFNFRAGNFGDTFKSIEERALVKKNKILIILSLVLPGCSTTAQGPLNSANTRNLDLATIESLKLDVTTRDEIVSLLGPPSMQFPPEKGHHIEDWIYFEGQSKSTRLYLGFDQSSGTLKAVTWSVNEAEPESDLSLVKGKYPKAKFVGKERGWINSHAYSDEKVFRDEKLGITLVYRMARQKVVAIAWKSPASPAKLKASR
jgi:hypothetical protein